LERKNSRYTIKLGELSREDIECIGAKAANLSELKRVGLPVPDGFSLTTEAFQAFLDANSINAGSSAKKVEAAPLPPNVTKALLMAAKELGDVPLAVRSSGVAEDLSDASYAGQYETVLDVHGGQALVMAVRKCWASAFSQRVKQYRAEHGQKGVPRLALLVQQIVQPEAAGVAFTANPVTGDNEVVVSAVKGLGERLVSGQASPDEWVVRGDQAICQLAPEKAIDATTAKAAAELARSIERQFDAPQDIEWALADGKLYLLQARPITALPQRPEIKIPDKGFWEKDTSHFPSPVTPLGASTYFPASEDAYAVMCQEWGIPVERVEQRAIGYEAYTHMVPMGGKEGPAPPSWIILLVSRLMPALRQRRRIAKEAMRSRLPERLIESWYQEWRAQFRQEAKNLNGVNLAELDDRAVIKHFDMTIDFMRRGLNTHYRLIIPYVLAIHELAEVCKELLGYDTAKAISLVSGLSETSSEPAQKLTELAATVKKDPAAQEIIADAGPDIILRLRQAAPDSARAFETYLDEYGHRAINYDPGSATLAENPQLLARLLRDRIFHSSSASYDPVQTRKQAVESARSAVSLRSKEERERFERALEAADRAYPVREDNIFYTDNMPNALLHYAALEIGRRLAARGLLRQAEDAVYLEDTELRAALRTSKGDFASLASRRKAERAWVAAHPGPSAYGKDYGPPDPRALPEPLGTITEAAIWFFSSAMAQSTPSVEGKLIGVSGSPGRYTGTVRIIRDESEFSQLVHGDVLVCPITTPTWSVLFGQAGAIVTDAGGVLSHSAIIAREHGIPAVLGTGDATRRLKNGQTVVVDGTNGVVQAIS